jgi:nicotianamine synthase
VVTAFPQPCADAQDECHRALTGRIVALHRGLARQPSLEPSPAVDELFGDLVASCVEADETLARRVVDDPSVARLAPDLREWCASGEQLLEHAWADRVLQADDARATLAGFPYLDNYRRLAALEVHTLLGVGLDLRRVRRVAFLGGGPLPLTALLLARRLAAPVDVVDRSDTATARAAEVARRLGAGTLRAIHADAATWPGVAEADVVVLAALVGRDAAAKRAVLGALTSRMKPGALLVARSATGLRTLLYPALPAGWSSGWEPLALVHPLDDVVNSVAVARRPHGP